VDAFLAKYEQIFIVEMNRDGQMNQILLTEYPQYAANFKPVACDGMPASAKWVREGILAKYVSKKTVSGKKAESSKKKAVVSKKAAPAKKASAKKVTKKAVAGSRSKTKRK
jgi:hypothetical protein